MPRPVIRRIAIAVATADVITSTPHVARARLLLGRCVDDGIQVLGVDTRIGPGEWVWQYLYQTGGFVKALVTPGC